MAMDKGGGKAPPSWQLELEGAQRESKLRNGPTLGLLDFLNLSPDPCKHDGFGTWESSGFLNSFKHAISWNLSHSLVEDVGC